MAERSRRATRKVVALLWQRQTSGASSAMIVDSRQFKYLFQRQPTGSRGKPRVEVVCITFLYATHRTALLSIVPSTCAS